jgi:hypothetical protein
MKYSIDKMHRIIKKFQQFPLKNGILKDFQRKAGIVTPLNHITDVKTRWNSLVNACKRFLKLLPHTLAALKHRDIRSDITWFTQN